MRSLYLVFLLIVPVHVIAQRHAIEEYHNILESWIPGEIILEDLTKLSGDLQYNHFERILRCRINNETKILTPADVQSFGFYDPERGRKRKFLTVPFDLYENGVEEPIFFEVLNEFENFAIMSTASKLTTSRNVSNHAFTVQGAPAKAAFEGEQTEYLYIFDDKGAVKLIMTVNYGETSNIFARNKVKKKLKDKDALQEYIEGPDYAKLEIYAKENGLSFKDRNDLVMILDYYKRLLSNKHD